jgi:hypothetical protein
MRTLVYQGGWYADTVPNGGYVVLMPDQHLVTRDGIVPLPPGRNLLYVRMAPDGIRFAGAGHQDDRVWEWDGTRWQDRGIAYGVSPVIYNRHGDLLINDGSWGSQGARFFVDRVYTGDETYYMPHAALSEYSWLAPHIWIGQSHPDGTNDAAWVYDDAIDQHYQLEPGPCRFIRATCEGEQAAIAIWKPGYGAVLGWPTLSELRALPIVTVPSPDPRPIPPSPEPEPPVSDIPSQIKLVERIREKYPRDNPGGHPLGDDAWRCIVEIAQQTGTLVFRKDSGEHCFIPAGLLSQYPDGVWINRTIIGRGRFGNQWVKVLGDGENTAFPKWETGDTPADGEYVDVSEIRLEGAPVPDDDDPPPTDPPAGDLESRVRVIEQWMARVRA